MEGWRQINLLETNKNAANNFSAAVEILINKPHVINKRLCGRNILLRKGLSERLNISELTTFLKQSRECCSKFYGKEVNPDFESFVTKVSDSALENSSTEPKEVSLAKKIKLMSGKKRS